MVKFADLQDAFFFVSSAGYGMHSAVLRKDTGEILHRSETGDLDEISEADLDWDNCMEIPHRNDLGLGQQLVFEFVTEQLPDEYDRVRQIFRRPGAYGRFKGLLASRGLLDAWFEFERQHEEQELRQWCELNGIPLSG
jgi:hypothetical protein